MVRLVRRIGAATAVVLLTGFAGACGGAVAPTAPTPVPALLTAAGSPRLGSTPLAVVDGLVQHDRGVDSWPLGGVLVEVLDAGVVTTSTTTDENGHFHFELPEGEIRFRGSRHGYLSTTTTVPLRVQAGQRTITSFRMQQPFVPPSLPAIPYAEWLPRTVTGRVTDVLGTPVASASVCVVETGANSAFACAGTDATGAYTVSFRVPAAERRPATLDVSRTGYPRQQLTLDCCVSPDPVLANVTLWMRVVSVKLIGPSTLKLGEAARISAVVTFDDGSEVTMYPVLFEVRGAIRNSPRGSGMIEGWGPGSGPVWWQYQNVGAGLVITVTP